MDKLRQDLHYRVADVEIHTIPLREMKERDIVNIACNLAYHLMWRAVFDDSGARILTPDIILETWRKLALSQHAACLAAYQWPGNMRQPSTKIRRFVLFGDDR